METMILSSLEFVGSSSSFDCDANKFLHGKVVLVLVVGWREPHFSPSLPGVRPSVRVNIPVLVETGGNFVSKI